MQFALISSVYMQTPGVEEVKNHIPAVSYFRLLACHDATH
jgi:hypothetical protein